MKVELWCPEVKKMTMASEATNRYVVRTNKFTECVLNEFKTEKSGSGEYKVSKEETDILKKLSPKDYLIVLDERGKSIRTQDMAEKIKKIQSEQNIQKMIFLIGGPYGLGDEIKKRADMKIKLSDFTFNSEVAIVVMAEQIYRIFSFISGHPYHNE